MSKKTTRKFLDSMDKGNFDVPAGSRSFELQDEEEEEAKKPFSDSEPPPKQGEEKTPIYEITPEQKMLLAPYGPGIEVTVKRSPKSGGNYERKGWYYVFFDPQTQEVVMHNDSLGSNKKASLKTFLEWQKQDVSSPDSQEQTLPEAEKTTEDTENALNNSENIWQSIDSCPGEKEGKFVVGGTGYTHNTETGQMEEITITNMEEETGSDGQKHLFISYKFKNPGSLYETDLESQSTHHSVLGDGTLLTEEEYKTYKKTLEETAEKTTRDTEKALNDSENIWQPVDSCRGEKEGEFVVGGRGYYLNTEIGVMQPFEIIRIETSEHEGIEDVSIYYKYPNGNEYRDRLGWGLLYTEAECKNIKEKELNLCISKNGGEFRVGGEGYVDLQPWKQGRVSERKKVTIKKIHQLEGVSNRVSDYIYIKYQLPDGQEDCSVLDSERLITKEEYEKRLEEQERALKTYDYLDQELNKNKSEKFLNFCRSLSELNLYNLLTKKGIKIENKAVEKILRKSTLSLAITVILAGSTATVGAAALGASLPFLVAVKRFFTAGSTTVLAYGGLRMLNEQKNKNLFLNEEQLNAEIETLKNEFNLKEQERNRNKDVEEAEKEGFFSKTKEGIGQYLLKRKIKKLEKSDDSKILSNEIRGTEIDDDEMKRLTEMQAQRAAALMLDGWNKEKIENDQTYRNLETLLKQMGDSVEKDQGYDVYLTYLSNLTKLKEQAWRKNFKKEQYKQWGHLIGAAITGILVSTNLVKDYHNNKTGYFNRIPSEPQLPASAPATEVAPPEPTEVAPTRSVIEQALNKSKELYTGQMVDATIDPDSGEGVIDALKRQIRANPKMFGFQGNPKDAWDWAETKANNLAFNQGYGNMGVRGNKAIAYLLESDKHGDFKIVPKDPLTGKIVGGVEIDTHQYKIPSKTVSAETPPEPIPSVSSPQLRGENTNNLTDWSSNQPLRGAPLPGESGIPAGVLQEDLIKTPETTASSSGGIPLTPNETIPQPPTPAPSVQDAINAAAKEKSMPESNFPDQTTDQQLPEKIPGAAEATKVADINLIKLNKLIENIDITKISLEQLSYAKHLLTAYGKENLLGSVNNINYYYNPSMATRAGKLFAQVVSQSREALKEYLSNPLDKNLSVKEALENYIYSLEHTDLPQSFDRWVPAMNPETGEVFNILKHGKIGGEIEYWLDDNGSGYASKIFNSPEAVKKFLELRSNNPMAY